MNNNMQNRAMRDVFIETIYNRMSADESIFFLTADFGSPYLDQIRKDFSDRFINVGIAEQNLVNVATGLALENCVVYAYAIAPFLTMRAYEQIRTNLAISSQVRPLNVNLVGVGAGFSYGLSGPTHHCYEDLTIMRLLPNMVLFSPSDWKLAEGFVDYSTKVNKPKYIRFDGKAMPPIYDIVDDELLSRGFCELVSGRKVCIVSTGYMTHKALEVAKGLKDVGVVDVFMLQTLCEEGLLRVLKKYELIVTVEEAFVGKGGLDSLVAGLLRKNDLNIRMESLGIGERYVFELGPREHLHEINHIDCESIASTIRRHMM